MIKDYKYMVLQRINKNEGEVRLSSISGPKPKYVTHRELKEALKPMVTHEELKEALKPMVTHEELKEALKPVREILGEILRAQQEQGKDIKNLYQILERNNLR